MDADMDAELNEKILTVQDTQEYLAATSKLTQQFLAGVGLSGLTKEVSRLLGNPVAVVDTAF